MEWTKEKIRGLMGAVKVASIVLILLSFLGVLFLYFKKWIPGGVLTGISITSIIFVLSGLKKVPEEQRWITEILGGYCRTLKEGLHWLCPFIEKVKTFISVWEQRYPLFEKGVKIDFVDGSATPKEAFAFVQCIGEKEDPDAPYNMVYGIKNVREATIALMENSVRSYLNSKTIDDALKAGHNIINGMSKTEKGAITRQLEKWGLKLIRVTIGDFDLDETIIRARESVIKAKNEIFVAKHKQKTRAKETMGALIQMIAEAEGIDAEKVQEKIRDDAALGKMFIETSRDLIHRRMAIDGKSFIDIRVSGAEGAEKMLLDLIAVWRKMSSPGKETKKEEPVKATS